MNTKTVPRPSLAAREGRDLGEEYVFYDRDGDQVHVLNDTARQIFLLCNGTRSAEEVVAEFSRVNPEADAAGRDAERIVDELVRLGLLSLD